MIVDFAHYRDVYGGTLVKESAFPALCARAAMIVGSLSRWEIKNISRYPDYVRDLAKNAVCAEVDFLEMNGVDVTQDNDSGGFTVGKVSVQAGNRKSAADVSPYAVRFLELSGLMNPQVETIERWG